MNYSLIEEIAKKGYVDFYREAQVTQIKRPATCCHGGLEKEMTFWGNKYDFSGRCYDIPTEEIKSSRAK